MNQLLEWINEYKRNNPTGWRKWIAGIVVVLVTVIAGIIWVLTANARGSQIAGLEAQRDAAQEAVRQAETNQKLTQDAQEQQRHAEAAEAARQQAAAIQQQLDAMASQHERNSQVIAGITSWDDVDRVVKP